MPSWEEANAASISAFRSVSSDVGNTYQQFLYGDSGYQRQNAGRDLMQSTVQPEQANPEYQSAERAYEAQEQEREYWEGVTVDDYQATDVDWQEYGRHSAAWERENPDPRMTEPDRDALDFDR
jgi:hypothetical protein